MTNLTTGFFTSQSKNRLSNYRFAIRNHNHSRCAVWLIHSTLYIEKQSIF